MPRARSWLRRAAGFAWHRGAATEGGGRPGAAGRAPRLQPKSMFTNMKADFGCATQPLSMFIRFNIEFGFDSQPNCRFNAVNIEFGWRAAVRRRAPPG